MELIAKTLLPLALALAALGCNGNGDDAGPDLGLQATIGREFVQQRGCPTCHDEGGGGAMAGRLAPLANTTSYPRNLTPDTATGLGGWADIEIVRAMRYGMNAEQLPLCPPMPHFDGSDPAQPLMTDVEADAIVAYLRALAPVGRQVPQSLCPPLKPRPPLDMAAADSPPDMAQHD